MNKNFYQVIEIVVVCMVATMGLMSCGYCLFSIIRGILGAA